MKTVKGLWKKNEDPLYSLLIYNATPLQLGYSPTELLMSRKLRTNLPMIQNQRQPRVPNFHKVKQKDKEAKQRQKWNFNAHHGARPLPTLLTGEKVWVTDRKEEGIVMEEIFPRSYVVNTHSGTFRRNRKCLVYINHAEERNMQSGRDGMPLEGESVGVNMTENGHQEEAHFEGNHQSEIEDPPEVVQREDDHSRVVSEQTDTSDTVSSDIQVNEQEPEVSFSNDDGQNPAHHDKGKGQPANQQDRRDGSSIRTRSGRISKPVHYFGT